MTSITRQSVNPNVRLVLRERVSARISLHQSTGYHPAARKAVQRVGSDNAYVVPFLETLHDSAGDLIDITADDVQRCFSSSLATLSTLC